MSADVARVERIIRECIGAAQAMRWTIKDGSYFSAVDDEQYCCPLGSVLLVCQRVGDSNEIHDPLARVLGIDAHERDAFASGFDGREYSNGHALWHTLGRRLRAEFVK